VAKESTQHALLIDTCVWLDLAKDPSSEPVVNTIKDMIKAGELNLYCPSLVKEEFSRNKDRVAEVSKQRLSQEFKRIRKVVDQYGDSDDKGLVISTLDDIHHKLPILTDGVFTTIAIIEELLEGATVLEPVEAIKIKSAERAINKKAPFHKNKNSMADAMIIEHFFGLIEDGGANAFSFVTHNTKDFSSSSDNRKPHEDFKSHFTSDNVSFYINLVDALKSINPEILEDYIAEHEWVEETRGLYEILDQIDVMVEKVWFNRHCVREEAIADGRIKLVPEDQYKGYDPGTIRSDIWSGALAAAENVKEKYPGEVGPFTDFEWGMLNGKLSALRWVLGDEWDMLDT